jgi:hypothetical protein
MQDDYMKRVRDGGGARDQLRGEGIVIFGDYAGDQLLAAALGLIRPGPGEFVSARLARRARVLARVGGAGGGDGAGRVDGAGGGGQADSAGGGELDRYARCIRLDGVDWVLAGPADPGEPAPGLPR